MCSASVTSSERAVADAQLGLEITSTLNLRTTRKETFTPNRVAKWIKLAFTTYHPPFPSPPLLLKGASLVGMGSSPNVVHMMSAAAGDELAYGLSALQSRLAVEQAIGRGGSLLTD